MVDRHRLALVSGGHKGAESEFGRNAERWAIDEITFSFKGHEMERAGGELRMLSGEQLAQGDVSMEIVSRHMGRSYTRLDAIRRVIQSMYHVVVSSYHVFAVGWIQNDGTVLGGTGWGVELAKFFNRPVSVFDQQRNQWFSWRDGHWRPDSPTIPERPFAATGTRRLSEAGRAAIRELFERSFGPAPRIGVAPRPPAVRPARRPRPKPAPKAAKRKAGKPRAARPRKAAPKRATRRKR
jgi:hypothetical protein